MTPRLESMPVPEAWSLERKDIHKIIDEFRDHLAAQNYDPPVETDGVVVLSASPEISENRVNEKSPENISRIKYSIEAIKQICAKKTNKPVEEINAEDIIQYGPPLVLNGETEQLPAMEEIAQSLGFPPEKIQLVNSGDRGKSNTKTQFEQMDLDERYKKAKHLTIITSSYHIPRVARTADKNLKESNFELIGVPFGNFSYNVYRKVRGEVKRILAYSKEGDLNRFIREPANPLTEFGQNIDGIEIEHLSEMVPLTKKASEIKQKLENSLVGKKEKDKEIPFNGKLASVDNFKIEDGRIILNTSETDYYSYLASSFAHRENQSENPIRPLAVSATLLTPKGEILFEKRPDLAEMGGKYHVFGGALKPGEKPDEAVSDRLKSKLGLNVDPSEIEITGADQENLQNIVEIFYVVRLNEEQAQELLDKNPDRQMLKFSAKKELSGIEEMFHDKDITDWNPSGFYNVMHALAKKGFRTAEEIKNVVDPLRKKINRKPYRYKYPIEQYLK